MAIYDVILFDLDGTLTDSKDGIINSLKYALKEMDLTEKDPNIFESFIGRSLFEAMQERYSLEDEDVIEAIRLYRENYFQSGIYENTVYPDIPELLASLVNNGKKLVVATMKPAVYANQVLENLELDRFFSATFGPGLDAAGISKTDIIRDALTDLQDVPQERIVMIGDRDHDVIGARENGLDAIAVTYGYGRLEELQRANPAHLARSVREIMEILK